MEYTFIHSEWTDIGIFDNKNNIHRKYIKNEFGTYTELNGDFIIQWNKWETKDIFIKIADKYIDKKFYEKYIKNVKLTEIKLSINHGLVDDYCINHIKNIIYKKDDFRFFGQIKYYNDILLIFLLKDVERKYVKIGIDDIYYDEKYLGLLIHKNAKETKKETFKKIDNNYYFYENDDKNNDKGDDNTKKYEYKVLDIHFKSEKINKRVKKMILSNSSNNLSNKNYLNIQNIEKYLNIWNSNNNNHNKLEEMNFYKTNFKIEKKEKCILTLVEWGYPPFGGGENWILNMNKIFHKNGYYTVLLCFSHPIDKEFQKMDIIDLDYVKIIQMPYDLVNVIKIIKIISPLLINHQGINRMTFMKISNLLQIPFLTGFCFWNNIIKMKNTNDNINMLKNDSLEKTDEFESILKNSYTYVASDFMNEIIFKLYGKKLSVIESISLEEECKVDFFGDNNYFERKYVTLINCHYNKGGFLIDYLCKNVNVNIPLQFVYTELDENITIPYIEKLIEERNKNHPINNSILIASKTDIKKIYNTTRILLIPSLCDETFCRVAYEGLINKIPILSTENGNLKYIVKDYAFFINEIKKEDWKKKIEEIYFQKKFFYEYVKKDIEYVKYETIENKIMKKISKIKNKSFNNQSFNNQSLKKDLKYSFNEKNIGFIVPWCDQGLGIQARNYYMTLKKLGYNVFIYSFRPYKSSEKNKYLQVQPHEWDFENIQYSSNYRENLTYEELLEFIYTFHIQKIVIMEATFLNIFQIAFFLKMIHVRIYVLVNIECVHLKELQYHLIFDYILCNNNETYLLLKDVFKNDVQHIKNMGFHLEYFYKNKKEIKKDLHYIKFCCIGGLNALNRKNIDVIIKAFYNLHLENKYFYWELNVYIQGFEIPDIIYTHKCFKINYFVKELSYKEIIEKYM